MLKRNVKVWLFSLGIVLGVAACLSYLPQATKAADIQVTAKVPAPLPTGPAVITTPLDQSETSEAVVQVEGTCSPNTAYVVIDRDSVMAGNAPCIGGRFTLQVTLLPGKNTLVAHSFSSTDDEGPVSSPVTVFFIKTPSLPELLQPPLTERLLPSPIPTSPNTTGEAFYMTLASRYVIRTVGDTWAWDITVHGGTAPFVVTIEWGDGTTSTYKLGISNTLTITHSYHQEGTYTPIAQARDANKRTTNLQFFAIAAKRGETVPIPTSYVWAAILIPVALLFVAMFDVELLVASVVQLFQRPPGK